MDLDGDGRRDILSGSYSRTGGEEMAGLFQVLYGEPNGKFRKAEVLKGTDGQPLIIPLNGEQFIENICTRPFAVDWNGDGHLDLVVGNFTGTFYWFQGEGPGRFRPRPEMLKSGHQPLRIEGNHSDPFAIDWDGDGDLDLLSGSSRGGVQWAENTAGAGKRPDLRQFRELIKPGRSVEYGEPLNEDQLTGPATSTRVCAADVNADGKLDLLVGDSVTLISPVKGLSTATFKTKFADWQKAVANSSQKLSSAKLTEAERTRANEEYNKVYERRLKFMKEDRTGFVWLYLRR